MDDCLGLTGKKPLIIFLGSLLAGFLAFLIIKISLYQATVQDLTMKNLRQSLEKQAAAVSYFYAERANDLRDLAASHEIKAFFENQALGMSMEYGLGASLQTMRRRFERFLEER